jgi:hypothetical protein
MWRWVQISKRSCMIFPSITFTSHLSWHLDLRFPFQIVVGGENTIWMKKPGPGSTLLNQKIALGRKLVKSAYIGLEEILKNLGKACCKVGCH